MVFWYNPSTTDKFNAVATDARGNSRKSSVQAGHRPYVVVSCDEGNITAPTCNIAPITDEVKTKLPVHVDVYFNGRLNTIMLEQVITVDQFAMKDYICMLTDDTLEKIEKALVTQYAIRPQLLYGDFDLSNVIGSLEKIVERIIETKMNQVAKPQATISEVEDAALKLGQMIEDLVGEPKTEEVQDVSVCDEPQIIPPTPQAEPEQPAKKKPAKSSSGRVRWTDDLRRQYLKDCDEMSPQEVMEKYGFGSMKSVFQTKYICKNMLGVK